jgi:hypothetical protein
MRIRYGKKTKVDPVLSCCTVPSVLFAQPFNLRSRLAVPSLLGASFPQLFLANFLRSDP